MHGQGYFVCAFSGANAASRGRCMSHLKWECGRGKAPLAGWGYWVGAEDEVELARLQEGKDGLASLEGREQRSQAAFETYRPWCV